MTIRNKSIKTGRSRWLVAAVAISLALSACGSSEESLEPDTLAMVDESTTSTGLEESTTSTGLDDSTTSTGLDESTTSTGLDESTTSTGLDESTTSTKPDAAAPDASAPAAPVPDAPPTDPPVAADELVQAEAESFRLLNELRASLGLAPLARTGEMDSFARNWSQTMATTGNFEHSTGPYAENIAWNSQGSLTPVAAAAAMHEMWVNSPGHYANMTNANYTLAGMGFYSDATGWHATHVFDR